jgi:hypothetical protein
MQTSLYQRIYCATMSMLPPMHLARLARWSRFGLAALLALGLASQTHAQSSCSSDGQSPPIALLERFISADCDACWATSTLVQPAKGQAVIDWIVPSSKGDDAALSAAATRDAQARLQSLGLVWDAAKAGMQTAAVQKTLPQSAATAAAKLRVAHGLPFNGYIGTSIEFTPTQALRAAPKPSGAGNGPDLFAHLVLVETLPAGAEGSDVERNLVRNVLITPWSMADELGKVNKVGFKPFFESRPISLPAGVNPERLRVLGWVQDGAGRILATAQSRCEG